MQEGRAEWATSLLFFHFVRITTPQAPKTQLDGGEKAQCQELARTGGRAVAGRAEASGVALHAGRRAGGLADSAQRRSRFASARAEPRKGNGDPDAAAGRSRLAREGAAGRLASSGVVLAHQAGRPRRDLLLSREASRGSLPLPARRRPLVTPTQPPGACGPPPGPRAVEQEAQRAGTRT